MVISRRSARRRSRVLAAVAVIAMSSVLAACSALKAGSSSSTGSTGSANAAAAGAGCKSSKGDLIGASFYTQQVARFIFEEKLMRQLAAKNCDRYISNFSNGNLQTQISQIQSMMQRGIKVLILNQIDAKAFAPIVEQAHAQGIKVIAYDTDVIGANADYLVERNNYDMGRIEAQSVLDHLPAGRVAKVAIIRGDPATPAEVDMGRAYDQLLLHNPKIDVVYNVETPNWDQATAQREAEAALQKDPNIDAFAVMWDNGAQAVVQALKSAGKKPGTVWVTGSDASTPSLAYIAQGWQGESTWTAVDRQAINAETIAHDYATGQAPPKPDAKTAAGVPILYSPLTAITKTNLCAFIKTIAPAGWVTSAQVFGSGQANSCG
jgi:D-xylose transport system substrate-binding protein